jgi:hypothetical protein
VFALHDAPSTERLAIKNSTRDPAEILAPQIVTGAPATLAGDALTKALQDFYQQNHAAIVQALPTGVNIDDVLGMKP